MPATPRGGGAPGGLLKAGQGQQSSRSAQSWGTEGDSALHPDMPCAGEAMGRGPCEEGPGLTTAA